MIPRKQESISTATSSKSAYSLHFPCFNINANSDVQSNIVQGILSSIQSWQGLRFATRSSKKTKSNALVQKAAMQKWIRRKLFTDRR